MFKIPFKTLDKDLYVFDDISELKDFLDDKYKITLDDYQEDIHDILGCVAECQQYISRKKDVVMYLNLKRLNEKSANYVISTIAHESFHAAVAMQRIIGDDLGDKTEERIAYEMDYILSEILDRYEIT